MRMIATVCAALVVMAGAAHAQNTNVNANTNSATSDANSASSSSATTRSDARSGAGAVVNFQPKNNTVVDNPDSIDTTPPAYAPGMDAGTNPCAVGMSGGMSITGFGAALGGTWTDEDCSDRNWFALLTARGMNKVAIQYACFQNAKLATALRSAGYKCQDHPDYETVDRQVSQYPEDKTRRSGVPPYCDDGGWATESTIRDNCPNPERTLKAKGIF